jgi:nucleoid DNA-binding protein
MTKKELVNTVANSIEITEKQAKLFPKSNIPILAVISKLIKCILPVMG